MNNIRKIRRAADMTQQELAGLAKTTKSYICELEKGKKLNPSIWLCYRLANSLNVSIEDAFPNNRVYWRLL